MGARRGIPTAARKLRTSVAVAAAIRPGDGQTATAAARDVRRPIGRTLGGAGPRHDNGDWDRRGSDYRIASKAPAMDAAFGTPGRCRTHHVEVWLSSPHAADRSGFPIVARTRSYMSSSGSWRQTARRLAIVTSWLGRRTMARRR